MSNPTTPPDFILIDQPKSETEVFEQEDLQIEPGDLTPLDDLMMRNRSYRPTTELDPSEVSVIRKMAGSASEHMSNPSNNVNCFESISRVLTNPFNPSPARQRKRKITQTMRSFLGR